MKQSWMMIVMLSMAGAARADALVDKHRAAAKKQHAGYTKMEPNGGYTRTERLRRYQGHVFRAYKPAGSKCSKKAIRVDTISVDSWSDTGLIRSVTKEPTFRLEGMPPVNKKAVSAALKGKGDPLELGAGVMPLSRIVKVVSFDVGGTLDLKGTTESWSSDGEVIVPVTATFELLNGSRGFGTWRYPYSARFTRTGCGDDWTLAEFLYGYGQSEKVGEERELSDAELAEVKKRMPGRVAAEKAASAVWAKLPEVAVDDKGRFGDFARSVWKVLMTGTPDEVQAVYFRLSPSYGFLEDSKFILSDVRLDAWDKTRPRILDANLSLRTVYCPLSKTLMKDVRRMAFMSRSGQEVTELVGVQENGAWKLDSVSISLGDGKGEGVCPETLALEPIEDAAFAFKAKLPPAPKQTTVGAAKVWTGFSGVSEYRFIANPFGNPNSNAERKPQAESNWKQQVKMMKVQPNATLAPFTLNGVEGLEARFVWTKDGEETDGIYRTIYLGNMSFEWWVSPPEPGDNTRAFLEGLETQLGTTAEVNFELGEEVVMTESNGRAQRVVIEKKLDTGSYYVRTKSTKKLFEATPGMLSKP